jgi:membrane associated rhomboid family serine protease
VSERDLSGVSCPGCGRVAPRDALFCAACGHPDPGGVPQPRTFLERLFAPDRTFSRAFVFAAMAIAFLLILLDPQERRAREILPSDLAARVGGLSTTAVLHHGELWRCLAGELVHDSVLAIAAFAVVLLTFGRLLERTLGVARFVVLFVLSGFLGSLAWVATARLLGSGAALATGPDAGPDVVPGGMAATWGVIGAVWGIGLRGVPARRRIVLKQIALLVAITLLFGIWPPRLALVSNAVSTVAGLALAFSFVPGGLPRREGANARRVAFTLLVGLAGSAGRGLLALMPDAEQSQRTARSRMRALAVTIRDAPADLDRASKAELARALADADAEGAGGTPDEIAASRRLRDLLRDGAAVAELRTAAQSLLETIRSPD